MGKFSDVERGTLARRAIELDVNGAKVPLHVRVLNPEEEARVLAGAHAFAVERGATDPERGDGLYDLGLWVHTAAIACIDADSPEDAPRPFFDGGAEQIMRSRVITKSHLAYLYEHQEVWQTECSPYERTMSDAELVSKTRRIAGGDLRPFVNLPPGMRWLYVRGLAGLYINSLADSSPPGSSSSGQTPPLAS